MWHTVIYISILFICVCAVLFSLLHTSKDRTLYRIYQLRLFGVIDEAEAMVLLSRHKKRDANVEIYVNRLYDSVFRFL